MLFLPRTGNRPDNEVKCIDEITGILSENCIKTADKNNMRVRVIGDTTKLSEKFQNQIKELESASAHNDGLNLQIAINYGSRDEMLRGMRKMYADLRDGKLQENEIDETHFEAYLDTKDIPDPDLLIRTSGGTALIELSLMAAGLQ